MKSSRRSLPHFSFLPLSRDLPLSILHSWSLLGAITLAIAAPSFGQSFGISALPANVPLSGSVSGYSIEHRVFDLINDERAHYGRSPLAWVERVADSARYHSRDMATNAYFNHADLAGKRATTRIEMFGLNDWRQVGENIAWLSGGDDPAARVVRLWMESPGHRENILNRSFRESGIGLARSNDGKLYLTQVFLLR